MLYSFEQLLNCILPVVELISSVDGDGDVELGLVDIVLLKGVLVLIGVPAVPIFRWFKGNSNL